MTTLLTLVAVAGMWQIEESANTAMRATWGEAAPELHIAAWIPRKPAALPGPAVEGRESLFIIHFWSSREPPTCAMLPRLLQIAKQTAGANVSILCISNDDADQISKFAAASKIELTMGADDDNLTNEAWLGNEPAFPYSFVVDAAGRVIWMGASIVELGEVLRAAIDGKWTVENARRRAETEKKLGDMMDTHRVLLGQRDPKAVMRHMEKMLAVDPLRIESHTFRRGWTMRLGSAQDVAAADEAMRQAMWNSVAGMDALLDGLWAERDLTRRDPALMLRAANRLHELTKGEDPYVLHEVARVQHELGQISAAVRTMDSACEKLALDVDGAFAARRSYFRAIAAVSDAGGAPASSPVNKPASQPAEPVGMTVGH